jgi:hypothetical protein
VPGRGRQTKQSRNWERQVPTFLCVLIPYVPDYVLYSSKHGLFPKPSFRFDAVFGGKNSMEELNMMMMKKDPPPKIASTILHQHSHTQHSKSIKSLSTIPKTIGGIVPPAAIIWCSHSFSLLSSYYHSYKYFCFCFVLVGFYNNKIK